MKVSAETNNLKHTFVNFRAGRSGEFILSLLMLMDNPNRQNITVSDFGSCHTNRHREKQITIGGVHEVDPDTALAEFKLDDEYPIYKAHILDEGQLLQKFCNYFSDHNVINILSDDASVEQIVRNLWFKVIIQERDTYGADRLVEDMKKAGLEPKRNPYRIARADFDILYAWLVQDYKYLVKDQKIINDIPNLHNINFDSLMNDKVGVIAKLCGITHKASNTRVNEFYNEYLSKQPTEQDMIDFRNNLDE